VICPDCQGKGQVHAHVNYGPAGCKWKRIDCFRCKATGIVPDEQAAWIAEGRKRRDERVARGVSLRDEARRLGLSPAELSSIERGMRAPTSSAEHP
jgi:hypothetical protein